MNVTVMVIPTATSAVKEIKTVLPLTAVEEDALIAIMAGWSNYKFSALQRRLLKRVEFY